jgi:TPR repeat protein
MGYVAIGMLARNIQILGHILQKIENKRQIFLSGDGVERNKTLALALLRNAAEQGDPYSLMTLVLQPLIESSENPKQLDIAKNITSM